jgi:putative MATE family efflux protein
VALAASSMGMALRVVFISLVMGLSGGGMALVARHIGARDQATADRATQQTELSILMATTLLGAVGALLAPTLLRWMGAEGVMLAEAVRYARVIFIGLWALELIPSMNALLQGAGSPEWAFRSTLLSVGTICLLQPLLILGWGPLPSLGVTGAALALVLGYATGLVLQQTVFLTGRARVRIPLQPLGIDGRMMVRILRLGLPIAVERFMPNLAQTIMLALVASLGTPTLAGYNVTTRLFSLAMMTGTGFGSVGGTLVGQNLGARQPGRAERSAWTVAGMATGLIAVVLLPLALLATAAVALFNREPEVIAAGSQCLRWMAAGQVFNTLGLSLTTALRGAGDTVSPMVISTGTLWLVQLPLAYGLSRAMGWGATGLWLALTITPMVTALAFSLRFRQGRWKTRRV